MTRQAESLRVPSGVLLTDRVCAYLLRYADLDRFRVNHRGEDPEVDQALIAMRVAAVEWRSSATGTKEAAKPELDRRYEWLGTQAAANQLGVTDSAIRKAIRERRLKAVTVAGRYRISHEELAHYRATRERHAA